jgi:hypothetical protein
MANADYIIRLDNDEVCVTEWRLSPGAVRQRLHQIDAITVPLTGGRVRLVQVNDQSTLAMLPGQIIARTAPCETLIINDGTDPVNFVEIELKGTLRRLISA